MPRSSPWSPTSPVPEQKAENPRSRDPVSSRAWLHTHVTGVALYAPVSGQSKCTKRDTRAHRLLFGRQGQRGVVESLQHMHERLRTAFALTRRLQRNVQLLRQRQARQCQLHRLTLRQRNAQVFHEMLRSAESPRPSRDLASGCDTSCADETASMVPWQHYAALCMPVVCRKTPLSAT